MVERNLENLGKVKITAEPAANETAYLIQIDKPILMEELFFKKVREPYFRDQRVEILGKEARVTILSSTRMRLYLPSTNPPSLHRIHHFPIKMAQFDICRSVIRRNKKI